ncbi:e7f4f5d5-c807-4f6f-947c-2df76a2855a4 [Sclerotinia trifoliorum]|uniref:E7f4f5d5-c807-4f6f-947c-2df76a2855a4 n=1 Tax=Sclerotinia trifoliorum TaxID=28548 RepID=A0A8H2ZKI1_9HELO|nr:e7f4f5d5-c807-4f6f-947c-2df76a2855a4 [Sclerotinia trifoliorum]
MLPVVGDSKTEHTTDSTVNTPNIDTDKENEKRTSDLSPRCSLDENSDIALSDSDNEHIKLIKAKATRTAEKEGNSNDIASMPPKNENEKPASWPSLPRKDQLFILALARMAEPIVQSSINSYMFFMLRFFDPSLSDSAISSQAGYLAGGFTAAQCITAMIWGRVADKASVGRKNVLIIGLLGTLTSTIGIGFCRSFAPALFFRCLGGALNGNVSIMRTMTSEIIREKKYQTKAFLLMPIMFNVGVLFGPLLGGWLQNPVHTFPRAFGPGSKLGGIEGVGWMLKYPYALPNLLNALLLFVSLFLVILGLEETHMDRQHLSDPGLKLGRFMARIICCRPRQSQYAPLEVEDNFHDIEMTMPPEYTKETKNSYKPRAKLPFRRILRRNIIATMVAHGLIQGHTSAFQNLWFLFLSTPRFDPTRPNPPDYTPHPPFFFTGGLSLSPVIIGTAIGIIGAMGLTLQFGVYSWVTHRLGVLYAYRYALALFPFAYALAPFLALFPTKSESPHAADGPWIWIGIYSLLLLIVTGRTFALPSSLILINNCTPHPSVLSTIHGIAQSVSAGARTLGPLVFSAVYGQGLKKGVVGMAWWILMIEAFVAFGASWLVYEGNGHEIRLEEDP